MITARRVALRTTALSAALAGLALAPTAVAHGSPARAGMRGDHDRPAYRQTNLVSDLPGRARITDPDLVNPWGLAQLPTGPLWVADNGADVATIYPGIPMTKAPLVVSIPGGAPTGAVANTGTGFVVRSGRFSAPAKFVFSSEAGRITAWAPTVPLPAPSHTAVTVASVRNGVLKGLALVTTRRGSWLLATDFHNGEVVVFDSHFHRVALPMGHRFQDRRLPVGYAPFGIQVLGGKVYVSYALQDADRHDDLAAPGRGYVDVYRPDGTLERRLISRGALDSPWGMAVAPSGFGRFSGDLLVGNFGNGHISAYTRSGRFLGMLRDASGRPITIPGVWGLLPGNGVSASMHDVQFSAGIDHEAHGLVGTLAAVPDEDASS